MTQTITMAMVKEIVEIDVTQAPIPEIYTTRASSLILIKDGDHWREINKIKECP